MMGHEEALRAHWMAAEQDRHIADTVAREQGRLKRFIRRRVADASDAEDIFQEVLFELVEASRLMTPIERVSSWLFQVARNRIIDLFRRKKPEALEDRDSSTDGLSWEELLPAQDGGPEAEYARAILLEELDAALEELPEEQRAVFVANEIEGRPFKELAAETGLSV